MAESKKGGCPHCEERDQRLAALEQRIAELESQLAKALKNSQNSSKPPSSDIVNPPPKQKKPGRRQKRKRGGQPGHARHQRSLFEEAELDNIWEWRLPACPCCHGPLQDADQEPKRFQQMELERQPVCIDEHRRIGQWCANCQKLHYPALPEELVKAGLVGPRLTALVG